MGGAISSVAGGNRLRLLSRSVGRRSQTVWKPWERVFYRVVPFSLTSVYLVCRRIISFAYSLSVLGDLPMKLVNCI